MLGIHQKPVAVDEMIVPPVKDGLKLMSIGFFLDEQRAGHVARADAPQALEQFLTDVHWGELDVLVVDMPPGTGDVSISLGAAAAARRGRRRDDAAEARAGRRVARRVDGAEDEHAAARRHREHERRRLRLRRRRGARRAARRPAARHGAARSRCCASRATSACRSSPRDPDAATAQAIVAIAEAIDAAARGRRDRQGAAARRLSLASKNVDAVREVVRPRPAREAHELRTAARTTTSTWDPAREGAWKPCATPTRSCARCSGAPGANRMRPAEMIDLGDRVLVQLRGRGSTGSARRASSPRLFQIVVLRDGKVVSIATTRAARTRSPPPA